MLISLDEWERAILVRIYCGDKKALTTPGDRISAGKAIFSLRAKGLLDGLSVTDAGCHVVRQIHPHDNARVSNAERACRALLYHHDNGDYLGLFTEHLECFVEDIRTAIARYDAAERYETEEPK